MQYHKHQPKIDLWQYIHHEMDAANVLENHVLLPTRHSTGDVGLLVDWTVASDSVRSVSAQRRQCQYYDEPTAAFHSVYTRNLCTMACRRAAAVRLCDCSPMFYTTTTTPSSVDASVPPACSVQGLHCLANWTQWFGAGGSRTEACGCTDECESIAFLIWKRSNVEVRAVYMLVF